MKKTNRPERAVGLLIFLRWYSRRNFPAYLMPGPEWILQLLIPIQDHLKIAAISVLDALHDDNFFATQARVRSWGRRHHSRCRPDKGRAICRHGRATTNFGGPQAYRRFQKPAVCRRATTRVAAAVGGDLYFFAGSGKTLHVDFSCGQIRWSCRPASCRPWKRPAGIQGIGKRDRDTVFVAGPAAASRFRIDRNFPSARRQSAFHRATRIADGNAIRF